MLRKLTLGQIDKLREGQGLGGFRGACLRLRRQFHFRGATVRADDPGSFVANLELHALEAERTFDWFSRLQLISQAVRRLTRFKAGNIPT